MGTMSNQFDEFPTSPLRIDKPKIFSFFLDQFGLYSVSITARCRQDEDLRIMIDELEFREIPQINNVQHFKIPSAWNGTELKGLAKTVVFILPLNKLKHTLNFIPKESATIDQIEVKPLNDLQDIHFQLEQKAENGNGRPWYTFALVNLPLQSISADVSVSWHFWDGDDLKLIIDNTIEPDPASKKMKNWIWSAKFWQVLTGEKREQKVFTKNLSSGVHYLEFWADKTPTLHQVDLHLGETQLERVPTVNDPEWTGNFADDINQMILARALFGEVRNTLIPDLARVAIGWVIRHRVENKRWPNSYWEVITAKSQFSSFNKTDDNRKYVENPNHTGKDIDLRAWEHAYDIAGKVIRDEVKDPTDGANHYYDDSILPPTWVGKEIPVFITTYKNKFGKEQRIFFYRL